MESNLNTRKMVKPYLFTIYIFLIAIFNLNGQIQKKTIMLGGTIDLYLESNSPVMFGFMAHPTVGYFPLDNLAVGLQMDVDYTTRESDRYTSIGIGPLIRYYIGSEPFSVFGHFAYLASSNYNSQSDDRHSSHMVLPGIGANYMLSPNIGIEGLLGVYLGQIDPTISMSFGLQIYFPPNN